MLTKILDMIYSIPFFSGAVIGLIFQRGWNRYKAHWEDVHHPNPDGTCHYPDQISRVWLAGLVLALSLGYVLMTAQVTHDQTIALTKRVAQCWQESYQSTRAQIKLNAENDLISRQQQELQRNYDRATSDWLKALVNPPGTLSTMDPNGPERRAWGLQITAEYQGKLDDLGKQSDSLVQRRNALDIERAQHPLPESTCGK
jgi:hypothetical protein